MESHVDIFRAFHRLLFAFFKELFTRSIWGEYLYATNEYIIQRRSVRTYSRYKYIGNTGDPR